MNMNQLFKYCVIFLPCTDPETVPYLSELFLSSHRPMYILHCLHYRNEKYTFRKLIHCSSKNIFDVDFFCCSCL